MQQSIFSYYKNPKNKQTTPSVKTNTHLILPVMIWITGLIFAGSEGGLMPYLNIAGAVIFLGASVWLGRILPCLEPSTKVDATSNNSYRLIWPVNTQVHPTTNDETNATDYYDGHIKACLKKVRHSVLSKGRLSFCAHDHGGA